MDFGLCCYKNKSVFIPAAIAIDFSPGVDSKSLALSGLFLPGWKQVMASAKVFSLKVEQERAILANRTESTIMKPKDKLTKNLTKTYHIIFDAIGCDKKKIASEDFVFRMLMDIPKLINMKILVGPNLVRDYNPKNTGITGIAIVSFSHLSIHTFNLTGEVFIDIFSCRPFDYAKVRRYLCRALKTKLDHVETLEVKYPWER